MDLPRILGCLGSIACATSVAHAQPPSPAVRAHAVKLTGSVTVDGVLDEPIWQAAPKQSGFVQHFPGDGARPMFDTEFATAYDDDAIYIGVWADDPHPELIRTLLTRRDVDAPADRMIVVLDSYHDRRTAYWFQLNAAGVQRDLLLFDDANQDDTWDAVWTGNSRITAHGWTAEFRIPLNQLRYADDNQEWGLQVLRIVARTGEQSSWSPWPRSAPQIVSQFGTLDGLDKLTQARRLELLPYGTSGIDVKPVAAGDQITRHVGLRYGFGLDLKYGLGSAFTLSATINPDFGQVEADPSQINLGPSELFYPEKRPFFLEGVDLFKLPVGNGDGTGEGQFYSRRIGATPDTSRLQYQYLRAPDPTTILGAMKLTGKTHGWSLGVLDAVTGGEETALIDAGGGQQNQMIAALTNYAVGRMKRDFHDGTSYIGLSATAVDRDLSNTPLASTVHDQAYTAGLQLDHRWDHKAWEARLAIDGSWIHGTADAIADTQQNNLHLYQRPDAKDATFDPMRTSLSGLAATWRVGRMGDTEHWRFGVGGDLRTPGLDLNDMGFQTGTDWLIPYVFASYHDEQPSENVLTWNVAGNAFTWSNLDPILVTYGGEGSAFVQFANYWSLNLSGGLQGSGRDPVALRGGPALRHDPSGSLGMVVKSDSRRKVTLSLGSNVSGDWTADRINAQVDLAATIQARPNFDITVAPSWVRGDDPMQYIGQVADGTGSVHYLTGHIDLSTLSLSIRANWTFSSHLSLQAYAQPYIAAGRYTELKDVIDPHAVRFADRFHTFAGNELRETADTVFVNYNGSYSFTRPDFNFQQLRSTVVLRWEYRPGSSIFAIWTHGRTNQLTDGRFDLGADLSDLAHAPGENIVMVKANYWIGL